MKAMIFEGTGKIGCQELDMPICGDNDVIIKNIYSAICGTDVSAYHNGGKDHMIPDGSQFGHEMVSRVVETGKNVTDFKVGDIVYPYPLFATGDMSKASCVGGFSEYILIPNCKLNHSLYKVHPDISLKVASLIEPFTVGCHAAKRATPKQGENAIVFGAGAIGVSAAITLKYMGCNKVMIVDFSDFRLEKCKNLGFETCNSSKEDLKTKAIEYFGEARGLGGITTNVDIYIDAVGNASIEQSYQALAKIFTRLVVVGVHHKPVTLNLVGITYGHGAIIGSGGYFPEDVEYVMDIMSSHQFDIESLITDEYRQEQLEKAILKASDVNQSLKVIISYE